MPPNLIFPPKGRPMNIICFGSGSGTTIEAIIGRERKGGANYKVRGILVNKKCRCIDIAKQFNVPLIYNSRKLFLGERFERPTEKDLEEYDKRNLESIRELEEKEGFETDLICLAGYWSIISNPLIETFEDRIINSHPADLSVLDKKGGRKYAGVYGHHAILEAIRNKEKGTRTCIHMVTEGVDAGEILATSRMLQFPKELKNILKGGNERELEAFAYSHQELQKRRCDYPAYLKALGLVSFSRLSLGEGESGKRTVYLDGKPLGYEGFVMEQMRCDLTELGHGRVQAMFSQPIAPLSGEELFRVFRFGKECEIISKGKEIIGIRASRELVEEFLARVDESGEAIEAYKKCGNKKMA